MALDDVLLECEEKMDKTVTRIQDEFASVRTGKASPSLVEHIRVDVYGTSMQMREVAGITCPEPRLIMIQPWDVGTVDAIRKAIEESSLGVNPMVDGKIVRIPIPELSEERRKDLIKVVKKIAEDGRIAIRHERRGAMDGVKKLHKEGELTEDDVSLAEKDVQKLTDNYIGKIDKALESKEAELLKV